MRFLLGIILALFPFFAHADNISLKSVVLHGLDKVTGRLSTMTVDVGDKATFGALDIYVRVCYTHPPEETPESAAYLDIVEKHPEGQTIPFSGWMFASSPALSAMDHAVYDIWVVKCQGDEIPVPKPEKLELEHLITNMPTVSKLRIQKTEVKEVTDEDLKKAPEPEITDTSKETDDGKATLVPLDEPNAVPENSDILTDLSSETKQQPTSESTTETPAEETDEEEIIIDELSGEILNDASSPELEEAIPPAEVTD